eukprot:scaffold57950_cov30-Tisochrysis_lutea.AAC.10
MGERFFDAEPLRWVEGEETMEELEGKGVGIRRAYVSPRLFRLYALDILIVRRPDDLERWSKQRARRVKGVRKKGGAARLARAVHRARGASWRQPRTSVMSGLRPSNSAKIQPTLHTSIAFVYSFHESMISGARYLAGKGRRAGGCEAS